MRPNGHKYVYDAREMKEHLSAHFGRLWKIVPRHVKRKILEDGRIHRDICDICNKDVGGGYHYRAYCQKVANDLGVEYTTTRYYQADFMFIREYYLEKYQSMCEICREQGATSSYGMMLCDAHKKKAYSYFKDYRILTQKAEAIYREALCEAEDEMEISKLRYLSAMINSEAKSYAKAS